jgi:serine-type D-Ala-D-Ala carboxypeptidase/endopeptidase
MENGSVKFIFKKPLNIATEIETVAVAGEFNDWNPKTEGFKLNKTDENVYQLTIKAESLGKPGEKKQFKFVVNKTFWIEPAKRALNVIKDAQGNVNLVIELK